MKIFILYKKSILIGIGFLYFTAFTKAQDLPAIQQLYVGKEYARAKESIDNFILSNDANTMAWLLKANIYNAIDKDAATASLVADAKQDAFDALKKAVQLDITAVNTQFKSGNLNVVYDIYNGYTSMGLNYFNAGVERNDKNSYKEALNNFKKAGQASSYIFNNGWGLFAIDTLSLYYTSKSAINTDKEEDAVFYCKKIIDNNITKITAINSVEGIYQWLVYYYKGRHDETNFIKYTQLAAKAFPKSSYFTLCYIDWYRSTRDYPNLLAQYQQLFNNGQTAQKYKLAYYTDIFNYLYQANANATAINNRQQYQAILVNGLSQYVKLNSSDTSGKLLLAKFYINQANEYPKNKLDFFKKSNKYLLQLVNKNTNTEALQLLIENYKQLGRVNEVKRYEQRKVVK
jgi:hypothetical protein